MAISLTKRSVKGSALTQSELDANWTALENSTQGDGITDIVKLTQAEYDALTPDATTLYVIVD
jgi:hypothetical protein